jgi:hypothetical protein
MLASILEANKYLSQIGHSMVHNIPITKFAFEYILKNRRNEHEPLYKITDNGSEKPQRKNKK